MGLSKEMQPLSAPFFPNIFVQNQFRTKTVWPPKDLDLAGKVAIVTGGNQGLGLEASKQLLSHGLSRLIIAVRSVAKGETAAKTLQSEHPGAKIDVMLLDMLSYDSIRAFVSETEKLERLDIAILNAGVRKAKRDTVPSTGHEETIQTNYISTALLCILLLPVLQQKAADGPGRISLVGSGLAFDAKFHNRNASPLISSFDAENIFHSTDTYNTSKLLLMMFLFKLEEYVSANDVIVNVVDPGFVAGTNLSRNLPFVVSLLLGAFKGIAARSLDVGASTYVDAAVVKGGESHGCYIMSWKISPFVDMMYSEEGEKITGRLWEETMEELNFADVRSILNNMKAA